MTLREENKKLCKNLANYATWICGMDNEECKNCNYGKTVCATKMYINEAHFAIQC